MDIGLTPALLATQGPGAPPSPAGEPTREESTRVLLELAHRKTRAIDPALLVRQALDVSQGAGFTVAQAALEAILRRIALCAQDELRIATRSGPGAVLGTYRTRRRRGTPRPYTVLLSGVEPLRASCDCDDYLCNSLGLCKHVLAVLDGLGRRRMNASESTAEAQRRAGQARLAWDPVRPLRGPGDWFAGLRYLPAPPAPGEKRAPDSLAAGLERWMQPAKRGGAALVPRATVLGNPLQRAELVAHLDHLSQEAHGRARQRRIVSVDPALRALLAREHAHLSTRSVIAARQPSLRQALRTLKQPLYPYQREGVRRFLERGSLLLADDMGLGKTAQAIAACHSLARAGEVRRGLLVVPAALKSQWEREWHQFSDVPVEVVEGTQEERAARYRSRKPGFLIANYEQVLRDLPAMQAFAPELLVLDEAQRIKNWATKTALYVKRLKAPWRLILTGTPMENRLEELASLLDLVDDRALQPLWRLAPWHTLDTGQGAERGGARHLNTLRERLAPAMVRRLRQDVLKELPARTDTRIPVMLTDEQRSAHEELQAPIGRLAAMARRRPLTQAEFLRLMSLLTTQRVIANGMAQLEFEERWPAIERLKRPSEAVLKGLSSPKLAELREILTQVVLAQGRKVVVFSQWRRMLTLAHWAVSDLLAAEGLRAVFFTGAESAKQRTRNLVDLHDEPDVRVLFATDAGGVGLNLQRAANCCIHLELPWNPAVLEQRIGRIYRLGQTKPIDVYALVSQDCIESRIADLVGDKRALFTGLFDGTSDEVRFDSSGSFLTRLERILTVPALPPEDVRDELPAPQDLRPDEAADALVAAAAEGNDPALPTTPGPSAPVLARSDLQRLFAGVAVERTRDGSLRFRAPPETTATLAALLEGLAGMLRQGERVPCQDNFDPECRPEELGRGAATRGQASQSAARGRRARSPAQRGA